MPARDLRKPARGQHRRDGQYLKIVSREEAQSHRDPQDRQRQPCDPGMLSLASQRYRRRSYETGMEPRPVERAHQANAERRFEKRAARVEPAPPPYFFPIGTQRPI